ncbi:MAG: glycoside hydrolase family 17 protein, partial [Gammaproteobacteria bacterium]
MKRLISIVGAVVLLVLVNFSIWSYVNNPLQLKSWTKTTMGVTFDPRRKGYTQQNNRYPSEAEIDQDLALLENKVHAVRTYSVLKGWHKIPELAAKHGLNTTLGAWIDGDLEKNRQEIETLIKTSNQNNPRIVRVMVGNEVLFRDEIPKAQLIEYIREVKKRTWRPVSTSETFHIWLENPDLVKEVDFIGAHILPYWNGIDADNAVDFVFEKLNELRKAYPKKPIVITEVGWPSDGQPFRHATASRTNQAKFLREFLNRAADEKLAYYIVEAFDQPWKMAIEGSAGAYWGIFDADRNPKYPMEGAVLALPGWKHWAVGAAIFSVVLMALFLFTRRTLELPGVLFFGLI